MTDNPGSSSSSLRGWEFKMASASSRFSNEENVQAILKRFENPDEVVHFEKGKFAK